METEHLFYLLVRWVPFYVSFACLCLLLCSLFYKDSVPAALRKLLLLLLATMSFNWLYANLAYYMPSATVPLMPLIYLCTAVGPVLFYHFIHRLTRLSSSEHFSLLHYALPVALFFAVLYWSVLIAGNETFILQYPSLTKMLPPLRLVFCLGYFVPGLLCIRRYRKAALNYSSNESRVSLNWLYMIALLAVFQIAIALVPTVLGIGSYRGQFFNPFMVIVVVLIALQAILLTYHTLMGSYEIIGNEKPDERERMEEEQDHTLTKEEEENKTLLFKAKLEEYFDTEKPFLKTGLEDIGLDKALANQPNHTFDLY